jgi:DNA-binding NarL/FixJ family response regulator
VLDEALADSSAPPPRPSSPHGLSPRELEVLRLVVEGHSNQEIAAELGIAPRTVANHVASMMNKLGLESRTAVATWAVRRGLG